jgi:hypothetical protein
VDLGVALEGLKPEEIEAALWRQLEARGTACLLIVDDVPSGVTTSDLQRYSFAFAWGAKRFDPDHYPQPRIRRAGPAARPGCVVARGSSNVLTRGHRTENSAEREAAQQLTEALGYYPLAVEITGNEPVGRKPRRCAPT